MKTFTDTAGREWTIELHTTAIKRVRSLTGVDLLADDGAGVVAKLIRDPVLLCDVVYAAVKPQADERGVSDEDFGRAMHGDPIGAATEALVDELVSFCPNPRDRAALGKAVAAMYDVMDKARDLVEARLGELTAPEAIGGMATATLSGEPSTSAPASPESTRAP